MSLNRHLSRFDGEWYMDYQTKMNNDSMLNSQKGDIRLFLLLSHMWGFTRTPRIWSSNIWEFIKQRWTSFLVGTKKSKRKTPWRRPSTLPPTNMEPDRDPVPLKEKWSKPGPEPRTILCEKGGGRDPQNGLRFSLWFPFKKNRKQG